MEKQNIVEVITKEEDIDAVHNIICIYIYMCIINKKNNE